MIVNKIGETTDRFRICGLKSGRMVVNEIKLFGIKTRGRISGTFPLE
jgi:hypothetical protein